MFVGWASSGQGGKRKRPSSGIPFTENMRHIIFVLACFHKTNIESMFIFCISCERLSVMHVYVYVVGHPISAIINNIPTANYLDDWF